MKYFDNSFSVEPKYEAAVISIRSRKKEFRDSNTEFRDAHYPAGTLNFE